MDLGSLALLKRTVSALASDVAPTLRVIAMTVKTIIRSFRICSSQVIEIKAACFLSESEAAKKTRIGQMRCLTPQEGLHLYSNLPHKKSTEDS
jgi:hypothetical protein